MTPNLLIAGGTRCATTFLHNNLIRHPGISGFSQKDETHFLAYGARVKFQGPDDVLTINRRILGSEAQWEQIFSGMENTYVLESSNSTLYGGARAVERIQAHCAPDVRIIVILRDPVQRMVSAHQFLTEQGSETLGLAEGVAAEPARIRDHWQHLWHYTAMGRYGVQLAPFIAAFGHRLCILDYEALTLYPESTITSVYEWLNLGAACPISTRPVNQSGRSRDNADLKVVSGIKHSTVGHTLLACLPSGMRQWVKHRLRPKGATGEDHHGFKPLFQEDIQILRGLLPRENWPVWLLEW